MLKLEIVLKAYPEALPALYMGNNTLLGLVLLGDTTLTN